MQGLMKSYNAECTADYSTGYTCKAQTNCQSSLKIARDVINMTPADRTTLGVSYAICAELAKRRTQTRSEVCFQLAGGCLTASSVNFRCKSITGRELSMSTAFRNIENDDESHQDDADATLEEKKTRGFSRSLLREHMLRERRESRVFCSSLPSREGSRMRSRAPMLATIRVLEYM